MGDTVSATTDTVSATTARGLLRPSPRPRLIPTCCTVDTVWDTGATEATTATAWDTDTTTARSAEAEPEAKADPYLLYGGYGYGHGLGYGYGYGLGYRGYYWGYTAHVFPCQLGPSPVN